MMGALGVVVRRAMSTAAPKRFFRRVGVVSSGGPHPPSYEITLDQKKLKTPGGKVFKVPTEGLAQAVAAEWDMQEEVIHMPSMHLTGLCNTAMDNYRRREELINHLLEYLRTDTLTCRMEEPPELAEFQAEHWDPVLSWFNSTFDATLTPSVELVGPTVSESTVRSVQRHLTSYPTWSLHGVSYGVESTKSFVLVLAALERHLTVEEAVRLCRLEVEFQTRQWGSVPWAHDLEEQDTRARLAAAVLFVHFSSNLEAVRVKKVRPQ